MQDTNKSVFQKEAIFNEKVWVRRPENKLAGNIDCVETFKMADDAGFRSLNGGGGGGGIGKNRWVKNKLIIISFGRKWGEL